MENSEKEIGNPVFEKDYLNEMLQDHLGWMYGKQDGFKTLSDVSKTEFFKGHYNRNVVS